MGSSTGFEDGWYWFYLSLATQGPEFQSPLIDDTPYRYEPQPLVQLFQSPSPVTISQPSLPVAGFQLPLQASYSPPRVPTLQPPLQAATYPPLPQVTTFPAPPQGTTSSPPGWSMIPQKLYTSNRWNDEPSEPILFPVKGRPGVNMGDARRGNVEGLEGRDNLVLQGPRKAVSCRFWFPGYRLSDRYEIPTKYWRRERTPIKRSMLAEKVAKRLEEYLDLMTSSYTMDTSTDEQWRIHPQGFMNLDNMYLEKLVSASTGTFQPVIWVWIPQRYSQLTH